jgi:acetyl-CoA carboxylase carboxyl transferase subunit beta
MGWFQRTKRKEGPSEKQELWTVCPSCKAHIFREEWLANLNVCPKCNFHDRIPYEERIRLLIDAGTFREFNRHITITDHLAFVDAKGSYGEKAREQAKTTGMNESVVTGSGDIHGRRAVWAIMDFRFLGGSLGSGTGDKIALAAEHALRFRRPYIVISASGGARMHEGIISLMQMAKTCAAIAKLHKARLPYISILTHPTTGGVSASYAMVGDINIAEPGALIGFAGRRVIEQTIKQKLPDDFQTAEYLLEHGFIDHIVQRKDMKGFLYGVLQYWKP